MAFESFPFRGNGPTQDTDWGDMWGPITGTGVVADSSDSLLVYADATGRQVKVKAGRGYVEGHFYRNPSLLTQAISANTSGQPRIDTVVARRSYTAKSIVLAVVEGIPAVTPIPYALTKEKTGIWEDALGFVLVGAGAVTILAGNVTDARSYVGNQGPSSARDTKWGVPATDVDRVLLHNKAVRWYNTDYGWMEQYFSAGAKAGTVGPYLVSGVSSGWYPVAGEGPWTFATPPGQGYQPGLGSYGGWVRRRGHGGFLAPALGSGPGNTNDMMSIKIAGIYSAKASISAQTGYGRLGFYILSNDTSGQTVGANGVRLDQGDADLVSNAYSMMHAHADSALLFVGDTVRLKNGVGAASVYMGASATDERNHFAVRYVSPPFAS